MLYLQKNMLFLSLDIDVFLANSADPNEVLHYAPFHLDLCLQKYAFWGLRLQRVKLSWLLKQHCF